MSDTDSTSSPATDGDMIYGISRATFNRLDAEKQGDVRDRYNQKPQEPVIYGVPQSIFNALGTEQKTLLIQDAVVSRKSPVGGVPYPAFAAMQPEQQSHAIRVHADANFPMIAGMTQSSFDTLNPDQKIEALRLATSTSKVHSRHALISRLFAIAALAGVTSFYIWNSAQLETSGPPQAAPVSQGPR